MQVPQSGDDQRPGNRADTRDSFDRVGHGAKEALNVEIQLGKLLLEESNYLSGAAYLSWAMVSAVNSASWRKQPVPQCVGQYW
jgi:hypothetical protein